MTSSDLDLGAAPHRRGQEGKWTAPHLPIGKEGRGGGFRRWATALFYFFFFWACTLEQGGDPITALAHSCFFCSPLTTHVFYDIKGTKATSSELHLLIASSPLPLSP